MALLDRAVQDELARRKAIIDSIEALFDNFKLSYSNSNQTASFYKQEVISLLGTYQQKMTAIDDYMKSRWLYSQACFSVKNNNLLEVFNKAQQFTEKYFIPLTESVSIHEVFAMNQSKPTCFAETMSEDIKGSIDQLLLIVLMMTTTLYLNNVKSFDALSILHNATLLDPHTSTVIQTTALPISFNASLVSATLDDFPFLLKKPSSGFYLLVPTLGYAYGGSRCDMREYGMKKFKNHDCSSSIVEWTGSDGDFATSHMEQFHNAYCANEEKDAAILNDLNPSINKALLPLCAWNERTIQPGMIFVLKKHDNVRHSGIITSKIHANSCFETLSYNRDHDNREGLGYDLECLGSNKFSDVFLFAPKHQDNSTYVIDATGNDTLYESEPS